jgi:hypothetical protein|tara:strand:- start:1431 stop:1808 length:378 start_codon:yes stop_codon:yes gene_type:complete
MWKFITHFALIVWFRENIKVILSAIIPIFLIIIFFTPLYWLWDSKLSNLGYGLYLTSFYTLLYVVAFIRAYFLLKNLTTNQTNKNILEAKKAILKNSKRIERFSDLNIYPKLKKKSEKILENKKN